MRGMKMLSVTILMIILIAGIAIFYMSPSEDIKVKERQKEYKIEYENLSGNVISLDNTSIYSVTSINNGAGVLNLSIERYSIWFLKEKPIQSRFYIVANVKLPDNLRPNGFKLEVKGMSDALIAYSFLVPHPEGKNVTPWPDDSNALGAWSPEVVFVGFTPNKSSFIARGVFVMDIWDKNLNQSGATYAIKITAEILGLHTPVRAVILFTLHRR